MKHFIREWGLPIPLFLILILSRAFIRRPVKVDGYLTDPTLADGGRLIILSTTSISRFDIVVVKETGDGKTKEIVKRVISMSGDTITYKNNVFYVNGKKADEDYLNEYKKAFENDQPQDTYLYNILFQELAESSDTFTTDSDSDTGFTVRVPKGQYYLPGDDRIVSEDSCEVGTFSKPDTVGEVKLRFRPLSKIGFIN